MEKQICRVEAIVTARELDTATFDICAYTVARMLDSLYATDPEAKGKAIRIRIETFDP